MEEIKQPRDIPPGPPDTVKCPHCKFKKHELLFNHNFGFFACSRCGRMFMDPQFVKQMLGTINNPPRIITDKRMMN